VPCAPAAFARHVLVFKRSWTYVPHMLLFYSTYIGVCMQM
jgi:hypothetical protein